MDQLAQQLVNGIMVGAIYAVVAIGFGLVFSVLDVLNMTHIPLVVSGGYITYLTLFLVDNIVAVILASALVTLLIGMAIERFVLRPIRDADVLTSFVVTMGVALAFQYGIQLAFGADGVRVNAPSFGLFSVGGAAFSTMQLLVLAMSAVMLVGVRYYVVSTRWGRAARAVAERRYLAAGLGIDVDRVSQLTVGISAALAGVAGAGIALSQGILEPFMGVTFGIKAWVALIVAGNKSIAGIVGVALALGIVEALVAGYVSSQWRDAIAYALMIGVLVARPRGVFGSFEAE